MTSARISRRHALATGAAVTSLAALAACGSDDSGSGSGSGGSGGSGSDGGSGGTVELTYWHRLPDGEGMTKVADIVQRWNDENPDIQVSTQKFDGSAQESYAKIAQAVSSGDAPDLAQVGYGEIASEFLAGHLEDVSAEINEGGYAENYAAGPMGQCTLGEIIVGLPQDTGPLVYAYDKAAFDELGITVPTTWDELKTAAAKAQESGKFIATWQGDETQYRMSGMAAAAGATWFQPENDAWTVDIAGDKNTPVAQIQQDLIDEGLALVLSDGRWGDEWKAKLVDGTLIGCVVAGWEPGFMLGDLGVEESGWQLAHLPQFTPGTAMTGPDGGSALAVIKGTEHKAEAVKFADWFNSQIEDLVSQGLVVAANTETPGTPENLKKLWGGQEIFAFLAEANETMNENFPYSPTWPAVGAKMNEVGGSVTTGAAKVADIFEQAQAEAVSTLKSAGVDVNE